jgi:exonuclease SbcC
MFEKEISEKEKAKIKLNELDALETWMSKKFIFIISQMEKHVLSKIYLTFNEQFKNLFGILIDDERLNSRIDETFTPRIEQNGYETEFSSLSGGEKTSLSLAYRLALHTAINAMITNISTKGLLLLDEPTDGFSSEQIDSMKDLFEKVSANQTIIVSHESKIESIADQVVRIVKKGHESLVL